MLSFTEGSHFATPIFKSSEGLQNQEIQVKQNMQAGITYWAVSYLLK